MRKLFKIFWSLIQKTRILIARNTCCLIVSFAIIAAAVLYVHTCVMCFGCPISSNVFHRVMIHPPVSVSAAEAETKFKMLQFTFLDTLRIYHSHFEGIPPNKNTLQRDCVIPVHPDMTHRHLRVKPCLKREI